MSVSAARLGGGAIPTIPSGAFQDEDFLLIAHDNVRANFFGDGAEWDGHDDNFLPWAVRSLTLDMNNFPPGTDGTAFYQAIVTFDGLGDGRIVGSRTPFGSFTGSQIESAEALQLHPSANFVIRDNTDNHDISVPVSDEMLAIGTASGSPEMTVVLQRDGTELDRAILNIFIDTGGSPVPAGFGASVEIAYLTDDDEDVIANIIWPAGLTALPNRVPLAQRFSDDFDISLGDDPVLFNTRTRIPPIEIREPASLGFNVNDGWTVRLTLERGFAWDRRHDDTAAGDSGSVAVTTDIGGQLGLRTNFAANRGTATDEVQRERNRSVDIEGITFENAGAQDRFRDTLIIGDGDMADAPNDGHLWLIATDNARFGPVRANVELFSGDEVVSSEWITVAEFSDARVLFFRDEDEDLEDYIRPSGRQEWDLNAGDDDDLNFDSVVPDTALEEYHQTAWVVLTETVRGVLPFTGLRDIDFTFPEGVQVLGVRWETNEGNFIEGQDDQSGSDAWDVWYLDGRTRGGDPMDTLITRNVVRMRPEIGVADGREEVAELRLQFYVSIQPEFEALYGEELWVVASGPGFDDGYRAQVAIVRDPITVETNRVNVGDGDIVAAGMFRHIEIDPIYVFETDINALEWDTTVQVFVEENTFIDTLAANAIILRSFTVETDGESGLEVGTPVNIGRGVSVPVTRTSFNEPGWIRFSDIQITGLVLPGQ
jgi:hypothetical protein